MWLPAGTQTGRQANRGMLIYSLQHLYSSLGEDTPGRTISPRQTVEKVYTWVYTCVQTLSATPWAWSDFSPCSWQRWTIYLHCTNLKKKSKFAPCILLSLNIGLWICVPESRFLGSAYIQGSCCSPALAHTDIHIHAPSSPLASHSKCKWRWSLEKGPAGGEMRLSFKGSARDALKLPITHLGHAYAGLRTHDRQRERKKGTGWRE